jgi:Tol biopolymer transport system component
VAGFNRTDAAKPDLWVGDLVTGTAARITHNGTAAAPVWNHDGNSVWFAASTGGPFAVYQREIDSLQSPRRIFAGSRHAFPSSVSRDGSVLAITMIDASSGSDVWTLPATGGEPRPLIQTPFEEEAAAFSPSGQLLAYQSNEAGRWEIYTHRLSDHRRSSVSTSGGTAPFWSADGRALFFASGTRLMRAEIGPDGATIGTPAVWASREGARPIGIDPRGRVLFERDGVRPAQSAVLTLHWDREVRQLLGPPSPALPR